MAQSTWEPQKPGDDTQCQSCLDSGLDDTRNPNVHPGPMGPTSLFSMPRALVDSVHCATVRGNGDVTHPILTASSSSVSPEPPGAPPSPCCATGQDTHGRTRADNRQPREKGLLTVFKIESMEVQALHQVPQGLGFKSRHSRVTHLPEERKPEERGPEQVCPLIPRSCVPKGRVWLPPPWSAGFGQESPGT